MLVNGFFYECICPLNIRAGHLYVPDNVLNRCAWLTMCAGPVEEAARNLRLLNHSITEIRLDVAPSDMHTTNNILDDCVMEKHILQLIQSLSDISWFFSSPCFSLILCAQFKPFSIPLSTFSCVPVATTLTAHSVPWHNSSCVQKCFPNNFSVSVSLLIVCCFHCQKAIALILMIKFVVFLPQIKSGKMMN